MKSLGCLAYKIGSMSLPVRGAWIEISRLPSASMLRVVAPRAGSVD